MKYRLFEGLSDNLEKTLIAQKKASKKTTSLERFILKAGYLSNNPACLTEIVGHYDYVKNSRITLFPESDRFFSQIKDAKFSFANSLMPAFPWSAFSVAVPVTTKAGEFALPSFRIRESYPLVDAYRQFLAKQKDQTELKRLDSIPVNTGTIHTDSAKRALDRRRSPGLASRLAEKYANNERAIEIVFGFNPKKESHNLGAVSFFASDCKEILSLSPEAILARRDLIKVDFEPEAPALQAGIIWSHVIRFVAGLSIHFAAMGREGYREGLPKGLKGLKARPPEKHRPIALPGFGGAGEPGEGLRSTHIRQAHYRQLTSKRFYQGEHAGMAPGTRWVKVKEALVNARAITATFQEADAAES